MKTKRFTLIALLSTLILSIPTASHAQWKGFVSGVKSAVKTGPKGAVEGVIDAAAGMVGANKGNKKPGSGNGGNGSGNGGNGNGNGNSGDGGDTGDGHYVSKHKACDPGAKPEGAGLLGTSHHIIEVDFDLCWQCVTPTYDEVFAIPVGDTKKWRFYNVETGKQVGNKEWKASTEPHFNKGVCAVQDPETKQWFILDKIGNTTPLAKNIISVTNFLDGVAIASTSYTDHFYINTKGQRIYPNVKLDENEIYPLIDGTRRMFKGKSSAGGGAYGYMDAHGNVVIKPRFLEARNFGSGVAIVFDYKSTQNQYWVINTMGHKVSVIPEKYAKVKWTQSCFMSDFVNSAAVVKNYETDKFDIVSPTMKVMASFDDASPFYLKTSPAKAQVCVVKNKEWEYPKFCTTSGDIINYANPMTLAGTRLIGTGNTDPWYETKNDKGEKTLRMPEPIMAEEKTNNPKDAWQIPEWKYTGYGVFPGSLTNDTGYVMNYEGLIRIVNWKYEKIEKYSADGYAKANKASTAGWRVLNCTWVEDLDWHMVFIDQYGNVKVEIVKSE